MAVRDTETGADGPWTPVCTLSESVARPILPFWLAGRHLILVREGNHLVACERTCPHEQADLAKGHCTGGKLFCPRHYAWFDLADGRISEGWSSRPLRRFPVRIDGDQVLVCLADEGF